MEKDKVRERLRVLEGKIQEVIKRMPAHSAKPAIMHELFELEDEKERLTRKLED